MRKLDQPINDKTEGMNILLHFENLPKKSDSIILSTDTYFS